ncbi:hypothetical protein [Nocardioides sp. Leaf285]|uniref:hypothetical protein n=1 Tax=Nocardioides sp. Leaf285 TaxID=1736322 RepID=UPI00070307A3|nr:hypothetical protein [Nocardioides sp. Leaf285]KQP62844.1 hypothetical protein ASF47_17685 [Nocardioides sp. Leaf285]
MTHRRLQPLADTEAIATTMEAYEHPVRNAPTAEVPDSERLLRARLVFEEALEFVAAMGCDIEVSDSHVTKVSTEVVLNPDAGIDLVEAFDAICDLTVVTKGSAHTLGLPVDEGTLIVDATNRAKVDPATGRANRDRYGKVIKPEGWVAPTAALQALLVQRGWTRSER